jgi:DNA-binding transcriptional MerR regulator
MHYTISETAALLGVTTHTLRYYEKMGIIEPETNEENGYRYYTVTDTRRFNLCREFRAADFTLEQCRELLHFETAVENDALLARQIETLKRKQYLTQLSISFLERMREEYRTLEQQMRTVTIRHLPDYWRLSFSTQETASLDAALEAEKAEWLACLPAVIWVSRIPRRTLEHFGVGSIEYDYGLMIEAEAAQQLGLKITPQVEVVPGGDYLTTVWKKDYRGSFAWNSLKSMHNAILQHGFHVFGDTFSYILASRTNADGAVENYHFVATKIYS